MVLQPVWEATSGDSESLFCSGLKTQNFASLLRNDLNSPDGTVRTLFFMRRLLTISFLLMGSSAFSQHSFTIRELANIYESQDKLKAIQAFELKGYTPGSDDDKREMFAPETTNGVVYSRSMTSSKVGFKFVDNKIDHLFITDSTADIKKLLPELEEMGFKLSNQHGEISKAYIKKKTNYFVDYEAMDGMAFIIIMRKTKGTKMLYNPKR